MKYSILLAATVITGGSMVVLPAYANPSLKPTARQATLMEEVVLTPERAARLNNLADEIERRMAPTNDDSVTTVDDVIQSDLLDGLLDENGEFNLPLGLTVYDAMGATSVGFGTEF